MELILCMNLTWKVTFPIYHTPNDRNAFKWDPWGGPHKQSMQSARR